MPCVSSLGGWLASRFVLRMGVAGSRTCCERSNMIETQRLLGGAEG